MAYFQFPEGITDLAKFVHFGDGDLKASFFDEVGKLSYDLRPGAFGIAIRPGMVFLRCVEIDDGVYSFRMDAERKGYVHITVSIGVDEGVDLLPLRPF